jgi:Cdc6-like AAA superfamily ATPase
MEALAALGLASNIIQFVIWGKDSIEVVKAVYDSKEIDPSLKQKADTVASVSAKFVTQLENQTSGPLSEDEKELLRNAQQCKKISALLITSLSSSSSGSGLSRSRRIWLGMKAILNRSELDKLRAQLDEVERSMQSGILARISTTSDAMNIQLGEIHVALQQFIHRCRDDQTDLKTLVATAARTEDIQKLDESMQAQAKNITSHVTTATEQTSHAIQATLKSHFTAKELDDARKCLHQSLHFDSIGHRRDQVKENYPETFSWLFKDAQCDDEDGGLEHCKWDSFSGWLLSSDADLPMYWITGKPGSGKTTLVRYILSSEETPAALSRWKDQAVIVSHYFWKPASDPMAKNLKGFLCSLLYQILSKNTNAIDWILAKVETAKHKTSTSSWTESELRKACKDVINHISTPVFAIIDGVDEMVSDDEQECVLEYLKTLHSLPHVKVCVASRPELHLKSHLADCHRLRLQDLTRNDLLVYAQSNVPHFPYLATSDDDDDNHWITKRDIFQSRSGLVNYLVNQADGVFLWLCLVIQSLKRGALHSNNSKELQQRIGKLPTDLKSFYGDMWRRLAEDDRKIYRSTTPLLLRTMILIQKFEVGRQIRRIINSSQGISLCILAGLLDPTLLSSILSDKPIQAPLVARVEKQCEQLERSLHVRTAGLVELVSSNRTAVDDIPEIPPYPSSLESKYNRMVVTWVHRTAYDFLIDDQEGKDILDGCELDQFQRVSRFFQACLARDRLLHIANRDSIGVYGQVLFGSEASDRYPDLAFSTSERVNIFGIFQRVYQEMLSCSRSPAMSIFTLCRPSHALNQFISYLVLNTGYGNGVKSIVKFVERHCCYVSEDFADDLLLIATASIDHLEYQPHGLLSFTSFAESGADLNLQRIPCPAWTGEATSTVRICPETPFKHLLRTMLKYIVDLDPFGHRYTSRFKDVQYFAHTFKMVLGRNIYLRDTAECLLRYRVPKSGSSGTTKVIPTYFLTSLSAVRACFTDDDVIIRYRVTGSTALRMFCSYFSTESLSRLNSELSKMGKIQTQSLAKSRTFQNYLYLISKKVSELGGPPEPIDIADVWRISSTPDKLDFIKMEFTDEERCSMATQLTASMSREEDAPSVRSLLSSLFDPPNSILENRPMGDVLTFSQS